MSGPMISSYDWYQLKLFIEHASGIEMGSLHVIAGVLIQVATALLLRISVQRWTPWLILLALELLNEFSDLHLDQWPDSGSQYGEGAKDVLVTMFLPTLLMLTSRLKPALFGDRKRQRR
jgi:hypothetical protein